MSCLAKLSSARELRVYRAVVDTAVAPALLGAHRGWLILEHLEGDHPDFTAPAAAAEAYAWLGQLHRRYAGLTWRSLPGRPPGMDWPASRARIAAVLEGAGLPVRLAAELGSGLSAGPRTLVHGDFHRWNLVRSHRGLLALDWEHAACAHPIWDLLLLAPGEPPRDDTPYGPAAEAALDAYHRAGPLRRLPRADFLRLQAGARLFVSALRLSRHRRLATTMEPGLAQVATDYACREAERVRRLTAQLT